jgi:hypothetical protein
MKQVVMTERVVYFAPRQSVWRAFWRFLTKRGEAWVRGQVEQVHQLTTAALELPIDKRPLFIYVSPLAQVPGNNRRERGYFWAENELWRARAHGLRVAMVRLDRLTSGMGVEELVRQVIAGEKQEN